ncbi:MAG: CapA family protein, partial [Actinobacteria bacterium]|nr:CapA family protein [Actinomycetota bacterium]
MPGRHRARRTRSTFVIVLIALATLAGVAVVVASRDAPEGAPDASSRVVDSPDATAEPTAVPASDAPEVAAPEKERKGKLVIHATGDVNLDPSYVPNLRTYGYGYAWSGLDGLFRDDDLTIVNLECAVSNLGTAAAKEFTFRGDP